MIVSYQVPRAAEAWPWSTVVSRLLFFTSLKILNLLFSNTWLWLVKNFLVSFEKSIHSASKFILNYQLINKVKCRSFHIGSLTSHRLKQKFNVTTWFFMKKITYFVKSSVGSAKFLHNVFCSKHFISLLKYSPVCDQEGVYKCTLLCCSKRWDKKKMST